MLPDSDNQAAEYRRKAEECLRLAQRVSNADKALFLELAETWGKLALQVQSMPEVARAAMLADHREPRSVGNRTDN